MEDSFAFNFISAHVFKNTSYQSQWFSYNTMQPRKPGFPCAKLQEMGLKWVLMEDSNKGKAVLFPDYKGRLSSLNNIMHGFKMIPLAA